MSWAPHLFFFFSFSRPLCSARAAFDTILVDHARAEKRFVVINLPKAISIFAVQGR
jgi:hypothetical protein